MSDIKVNNIQGLEGTHGPVVSGIATMSSVGAMTLPRGDTAYRGGRGRGIWGGGIISGNRNAIQYVTISTTGDAKDFGDLTVVQRAKGAAASSTRALWAGGLNSVTIEYVTISSTGNAFDFGDLSAESFYPSGAGDKTRALFAGGYDAPNTFYKKIEYVTIASKGNSSHFGFLHNGTQGATGSSAGTEDVIRGGRTVMASCASPTRAIFAGGNEGYNYPTTSVALNAIDYVTIQTLGNAFDFGDLLDGRTGLAGCSNSTRGVFAGGHTGPVFNTADQTNVIAYITIASMGDAIDFGDLTQDRERFNGVSNQVRGVFGGGHRGDPKTQVDTIDFVTIASLGNATEFGDMIEAASEQGGISDSHGGLE